MARLKHTTVLDSIELSVEGVDNDKSTISGAKVIELGHTNDARPFTVDEKTLDQVVEMGNRTSRGVKVRLTHPKGEQMGLHLGRIAGFYREGDSVRADVNIAASSRNSPRGDIGGYVLTLAEEDSEALGMSVAGKLDKESMLKDSKDGILPIRFHSLYAVDVVSEPAATRGGLFSIQEEEFDMSDEVKDVKVEDADQKAPEATETPVKPEADKDVPKLEEVVDKAPEAPEVKADEKKDEVKEPVTLEAKGHEDYIELFGDQGATWFLEGKTLVECLSVEYKRVSTELEEAQGKLDAIQLGVEDAPKTNVTSQLSDEQRKEVEQAQKDQEKRKKGIDPKLERIGAAMAKV